MSDPSDVADDPSHETTDTGFIQRVEQEQALADAHRTVEALQEENKKIRHEKEVSDKEREDAVSIVNQLRTQLSNLQSSHHEVSSSLSVIQTRWELSEREKLELLEETTKLQDRNKRANEELYILRSQKAEASQKIAHLDVEVSELKMIESTAKFNEERSVAALQSARTEILSLTQAVTDVEERFGRYRIDKQSELQQIQVEQDNFTSRLTSVERSYRSLQQAFDSQARRLADAHSTIATLTSASASQKASFRVELNHLNEEIRLLEKRCDNARKALADRETEMERLAEAQAHKEQGWKEKCKKEESARREAEKRSEDLKLVVERLATANGEGATISAAASVASGMKQSRKTYTEFYRDYVIQEGKLRASEIEVDNLQQLLDEITQDIEERKHDLESQAAEKDRAVENVNTLATELAAAQSARDAKEAKIKALTAESKHLTEEITELRSTTEDLARQVQGLLRQIAIRDDPSLATVTIDGQTPIQEGDVISDRLVEFKSIRQLQQQNQRLLKVSRGLMAKLDQREIRRAAADEEDLDTGATLDEATKTIAELQDKLIDTSYKADIAIRERDMFAKLVVRGDTLKRYHGESGDNPPEDGEASLSETINTLRAELDVFKGEMESQIGKAREQVPAKDQALGVSEVEKAKAEAKITILEEQQRILNDSITLQKQEYSNLEKVYRESQNSVSQVQLELRNARQETETHRAAVERARNEVANLRAEKDQWKSHESRLEQNLRTVNEERAKLQHLIDNLQNVSRENEQTRAEERQRWERREEALQRDCAALRAEVDRAKEETRNTEKRAEDFDARLESATTAVRAEKQAAEALVTTQKAEIDKLSKQSEDRMRIGLNWKKRAESLQPEVNKLNEEKTALQKQMTDELEAKNKEMTELNGRIATLTSELEDVRKKVSDAERKLSEAEKTVQAKDLAVKRLQADASRVGSPGPVDNTALTALQTERDNLLQQLEQARKEIENVKVERTASSGEVQTVTAEEKAQWEAERASERANHEKRYEEGVLKVNRANANLKNRVDNLTAEKTTLDSRVAELQAEVERLRTAQSQIQSTSNVEAGEIVNEPSQEVIDNAVKAAVAAREAELAAQHAAALQAASLTVQSQAVNDPAAIQAAVSAKESELNAAFEIRLAEAVAAAKSSQQPVVEGETSAVEATLKSQIEELEKKIKTLERQARTTEISRKTLERQKTEAEAKAARLEAASTATLGSTTTLVAPSVPEIKVDDKTVDPTTIVAGPSGSNIVIAPAASGSIPTGPANVSPASRPALRGVRGRGGAVRGTAQRGGAPNTRNSILSTVNAQLASTASANSDPTSPTGNKRPLPDDVDVDNSPQRGDGGEVVQSDILARIQGGAAALGEGGHSRGRLIKRPRGTGSVRGASGRGGAAAARRSSATGTGTGGAGTGTGEGNGSGNGNGASGTGDGGSAS